MSETSSELTDEGCLSVLLTVFLSSAGEALAAEQVHGLGLQGRCSHVESALAR